jgi:hypothetical protein
VRGPKVIGHGHAAITVPADGGSEPLDIGVVDFEPALEPASLPSPGTPVFE